MNTRVEPAGAFPGPGAIKAGQLVKRMGKKLVGCQVKTVPMGEWPGGIAKVIGLYPDKKGAPEIVFQVEASFWPDGPMGVFANEPVELLEVAT